MNKYYALKKRDIASVNLLFVSTSLNFMNVKINSQLQNLNGMRSAEKVTLDEFMKDYAKVSFCIEPINDDK